MYDGSPPSPPDPPDPSANSRYVYLLARLRGRQITMEEATELFGIMQGMIRSAASAPAASAYPAPPPPPPPPPPPGIGAVGVGDDLYWISILALGAGAGLGAAVTKRLTEGPPPSSRRASARANGR